MGDDSLARTVIFKCCCAILLIPSFLWDLWNYILLLYKYNIRRDATSHEDRVKRVQEQVISWRVEGKGRKMCTARPSWKSITQQKLGYKDRFYRVNVELDRVLEVDENGMTVKVEPSVCIGFLNRFLVTKGYTLPVVPELDMLSVGGLVMGGGIESTSHKYGLFHHICKEYELVTADGEVVVANQTTNHELFHSVPMNYGTLGFLTSVKVKLVPYKPYIRLTYRPTSSLQDTVQTLNRETNKECDNDSVEGIMYNVNEGVIMTGTFVEEREVDWSRVNNMGYWYKPWFFKHVQSFLQKGESVEYVPTLHFHQRHNKPCFWLTPLWLPWAENWLARFLIGWALPLNTQLLKLIKEKVLKIDYADNCVLQDFIIPINKLKEAILLSSEMVDIWPIWMVPACLDTPEGPESIQPWERNTMYVDFGVYGHSDSPRYKGREQTLRVFEKFTLENNGYQALYAESLLEYDEFIKMFPQELYKKMRKSLPFCEEAFPTTYEKVSRIGRQRVM